MNPPNHLHLLFLTLFSLSLTRCSFDRQVMDKMPILTADREAPLGWMYLRIYADNTFEFESRGLERKGEIFAGTVSIQNDTLRFTYFDAVPRAGFTAIVTESQVVYIDGEYPERLAIKRNELKMMK
jgi:hypothetical protein